MKKPRDFGPIKFLTVTPNNSDYRDTEGRILQVSKLLELARDLPVFDVQIAAIWLGGETFQPIGTIYGMVEHMKRVMNVDITYPIILGADGHIMDGNHRIMRALLDGRTHIPAKRFVVQPEIN